MRLAIGTVIAILALAPQSARAQLGEPFDIFDVTSGEKKIALPPSSDKLALVSPVALPRMSPELALETYLLRAARQPHELASYTALSLIKAELPDSAQKGEYELKRHYAAPKTLLFTALRFTGDNFVKANVIGRLLQTEVDHVSKQEAPLTAINAENYKFHFKGTEEVDGRFLHVFQLKPRHKRAGLFKGRIYVDAQNGVLRRAEGTMVKSPSFFVKKIEFVQDYGEFGQFTFPLRTHSEAKTRLVGRAVVDIVYHDYEATAVSEPAPGGAPAADMPTPN